MRRVLYSILCLGLIAFLFGFYWFKHKDGSAKAVNDDIYVCAYVWP